MKTIENGSLLVANYIARFEIFMKNIVTVVLEVDLQSQKVLYLSVIRNTCYESPIGCVKHAAFRLSS